MNRKRCIVSCERAHYDIMAVAPSVRGNSTVDRQARGFLGMLKEIPVLQSRAAKELSIVKDPNHIVPLSEQRWITDGS